MHAHAIGQIEPTAKGIHLLWTGPHTWVYSPGGWWIQRRIYNPKDRRITCRELGGADLANLAVERELAWPFGTLLLREGQWPAGKESAASLVFTLELFEATSWTQITVKAANTFAFALFEGKVVATAGPKPGSTTLELGAIAFDTVIVYSLQPGFVRFCVESGEGQGKDDWADVPYIVKGLQLPLKELMPSLDTPEKEFLEGQSRLLAGESLDEEEFFRLMETIRAGVRQALPPRPVDQVLLMREEATADFEEMTALDPLRILLSHPKWRRVLGFGWFDEDGLVPGVTYEYRITGHFPLEDLHDRVYGFHTVPSQTLLPSRFSIDKLRLRLPEPVLVQRSPLTPETGLRQISRRGIPLGTARKPWWSALPSLDNHSLVLNFPTPVESLVLELEPGHELKYTAHAFGGISLPPQPVPAGASPLLDFSIPVTEIRLRGTGFLYTIRVPSDFKGMGPLSVVLAPVVFQNTPRPLPPLQAGIQNLQQPQPTPQPDDQAPEMAPRRPALGFNVSWQPALKDGLAFWPSDADAAPPLDAALFQIEHREEVVMPALPASILQNASSPRLRRSSIAALRKADLPENDRQKMIRALLEEDTATFCNLSLESAGPWQPVLPEENWTLGNRTKTEITKQLHHGVDLLTVFPEIPRRGDGNSLDLSWSDVFDFKEGGNPIVRPLPKPGTFHRYRVRSVDAIGRPSDDWTETDVLRLEKHVAPPVPVGPDQEPADEMILPAPSGVQAKVIVRDQAGLTDDDLLLLGSDENVIVLQWGWHQEQRLQDDFAKEFRVYLTDKPLDFVRGTLLTYSAVGLGEYEVTIQLERTVVADAAKDAPLDAGYPFMIYGHTAGTTITAMVGTRVTLEDGSFHEPQPGPVVLHVHLTPDLMRPPSWTERHTTVPITAETRYEVVFRNLLTLTPEQQRDAVWVGVSTADDQDYVPDQLVLPPGESRPGNESAIVPVLCEGRYHGRPVFDIPPALNPVPVLTGPEPTDKAVTFDLDLSPYLPATGLGAGDLIRPGRLSASSVFTAYYVEEGAGDPPEVRIMAKVIDRRNDSEADQEVGSGLNPEDKDAIVAALNGNDVSTLENRFVVFLAGAHPYRDRLFQPAVEQPVPFGAFPQTLPPVGERYVYHIRKSDVAGHLSAGGAVAPVVVKVPSMTPGAPVSRVAREEADAADLLRLKVGPDPAVAFLLTFELTTEGDYPIEEEAALVRVPNRPDLYPHDGIRLRTPDGQFLSPLARPLDEGAPDVSIDADGFRRLAFSFGVSPGRRTLVWACTMTPDGILSKLGGPWGLQMPPPPLPVPVLTVVSTPAGLLFSWAWGEAVEEFVQVYLERSRDGHSWRRFTPLMTSTTTNYSYIPPPGSWMFRVVVKTPAGRKAAGDAVTTS